MISDDAKDRNDCRVHKEMNLFLLALFLICYTIGCSGPESSAINNGSTLEEHNFITLQQEIRETAREAEVPDELVHLEDEFEIFMAATMPPTTLVDADSVDMPEVVGFLRLVKWDSYTELHLGYEEYLDGDCCTSTASNMRLFQMKLNYSCQLESLEGFPWYVPVPTETFHRVDRGYGVRLDSWLYESEVEERLRGVSVTGCSPWSYIAGEIYKIIRDEEMQSEDICDATRAFWCPTCTGTVTETLEKLCVAEESSSLVRSSEMGACELLHEWQGTEVGASN